MEATRLLELPRAPSYEPEWLESRARKGPAVVPLTATNGDASDGSDDENNETENLVDRYAKQVRTNTVNRLEYHQRKEFLLLTEREKRCQSEPWRCTFVNSRNGERCITQKAKNSTLYCSKHAYDVRKKEENKALKAMNQDLAEQKKEERRLEREVKRQMEIEKKKDEIAKRKAKFADLKRKLDDKALQERISSLYTSGSKPDSGSRDPPSKKAKVAPAPSNPSNDEPEEEIALRLRNLKAPSSGVQHSPPHSPPDQSLEQTAVTTTVAEPTVDSPDSFMDLEAELDALMNEGYEFSYLNNVQQPQPEDVD